MVWKLCESLTLHHFSKFNVLNGISVLLHTSENRITSALRIRIRIRHRRRQKHTIAIAITITIIFTQTPSKKWREISCCLCEMEIEMEMENLHSCVYPGEFIHMLIMFLSVGNRNWELRIQNTRALGKRERKREIAIRDS